MSRSLTHHPPLLSPDFKLHHLPHSMKRFILWKLPSQRSRPVTCIHPAAPQNLRNREKRRGARGRVELRCIDAAGRQRLVHRDVPEKDQTVFSFLVRPLIFTVSWPKAGLMHIHDLNACAHVCVREHEQCRGTLNGCYGNR